MRLINTSTLELRDFSMSTIPEYAILSHTWSNDEVTFKDMASPNRVHKKGWHKIVETCQLARERSIGFAWVDTCSIDKSSSAELTESINSMFQWYENPVVCYVLLEDMKTHMECSDHMSSCRWFTRGWTLQELLASKVVKFFDSCWAQRGSKATLLPLISSITGVPFEALLFQKDLTEYSVAERMSWAARRHTSRLEDLAYCLLGISMLTCP